MLLWPGNCSLCGPICRESSLDVLNILFHFSDTEACLFSLTARVGGLSISDLVNFAPSAYSSS